MKKIIQFIIIPAMLILIIAGCKKLEDFGDTNVNPATTNSPITSALLTSVLSSIFSGWPVSYGSLYCQYFSETQYTESSRYANNQNSAMGLYSGGLYDLQNIIINNTDPATSATAGLNGANNNQIAIARILKAYYFWTITDWWGDIPYFDALEGNPNVPFDTQESIYKDIIKELSEAVAQFTTGAPVKGDIVYNGDISKWKKFANSLRMLMSLRLSKQYPLSSDYAAIQFRSALEDLAGSISTNDENFMVSFPGGNFRNPYYSIYDGRRDYGE
jgi:hypothetical protein